MERQNGQKTPGTGGFVLLGCTSFDVTGEREEDILRGGRGGTC